MIKIHVGLAWWRTPLTPALGRQRQVNLGEFEASLVYKVSSRLLKGTRRNPVSKDQKIKNKNKKRMVEV